MHQINLIYNKRFRTALLKLFFLFISILLALCMGEGLLRILGIGIGGADYRAITIKDEIFGYRFRPNASLVITGKMKDYKTFIRTNSLGFRSREHLVSNKMVSRRIILLGDSEIFGQGVNESNMLDVILESLLNAHARQSFEIINLALPGIGTLAQERILCEFGIPFQPEAIILFVTVGNDLRDNVSYIHTGQYKKIDLNRRISLKSSYLYNFARGRFIYLLRKMPAMRTVVFSLFSPSAEDLPNFVEQWYTGQWVKDGWPLTTEVLDRIQQICKKNSIKMFLAVIPSLPQFNKDHEALTIAMTPDEIINEVPKDPRRPQRMFKEFCMSHSIHYVELLDDFIQLSQIKGVQLKHPNDGHLNAPGTRAIAEILVRELQNDGWIR